MAKFIGLAIDTVPAGSTLDLLGPTPVFATPTLYLPVSTAQVTQGYTNSDRANEVRGIRGAYPGIAFQADPTLTFTVRLYPSIAKFLFPKFLGGAPTSTGTAPASIVTAFQTGATVPALQALLVRGTQTDRMTGAWIDTAEVSFPADGDPELTITMRGLFHKHYVTAAPPTPTYTTAAPYSTVTLKTLQGSVPTAIPCVTSMTLTYDNQLRTDQNLRYCKGANIESATVGGQYVRRQYPGLNLIGNQQITGTIDLPTVNTTQEDRLRVATADALIFEATSDPITPATTPPADELLRMTIPAGQITGGGASELVSDADSTSSYTFGGFIDPATGASFKAEFVTAAAVPA